jgi:ribonuclease HI
VGLILNIDGGARGNPGPAGAGVVLKTDDGRRICEAGFFLGRQTNNAAEYNALIRGLQRAQRCDPQPIRVCSDSELLVRQVTGAYRVRSAALAKLYQQVQLLLIKVSRWSIHHVRREENQLADRLANLAMDQRRDVVVYDIDAPADPRGAELLARRIAAEEQGRRREDPDEDAPGADVAPATDPEGGASIAATVAGSSAAAAGSSATVAESSAAAPRVIERTVQVRVARLPAAGACPAGGIAPDAMRVAATLPGGLCIHAAYGILPALLSIMNADAREFAAIPTLTVRCNRPECGAVFQLSPVVSSNGSAKA